MITKADCKPVLGLKAAQHTRLMTVNVENIAVVTTLQGQAERDTGEYSDVCEGEGTLEGQLHLQTDATVSPVKMPCRKWPLAIRKKVKDELKRLKDMNIV